MMSQTQKSGTKLKKKKKVKKNTSTAPVGVRISEDPPPGPRSDDPKTNVVPHTAVAAAGEEQDEQTTKNPKHRKKKTKSKTHPFVKTILDRRNLNVCAPMVGGSELAFRLLVREYNADLCYTPMLYSDKFVGGHQAGLLGNNCEPEYSTTGIRTAYAEEQFFQQLHKQDRPLVAHFCGNNPQTLLKACKLVENHCDAVDLNLGCPQRVAHAGHFGAYLLGAEDRPLLKEIVETLAKNLSVPVFCKIRLLESYEETLELCKDLKTAGCALIAIHARQRGTATRRREGPANLDWVKRIVEDMSSGGGASTCCSSGGGGEKAKTKRPFPIFANGNVQNGNDVEKNLKFTNAHGIMSAEGLLDNPRIFFKATRQNDDTETKLRRVEGVLGHEDAAADPHNLLLAEEYLQLAALYPPPESEKGNGFSTVRFHVRRMCKGILTETKLLEAASTAESVAEIREILAACGREANKKLLSLTTASCSGTTAESKASSSKSSSCSSTQKPVKIPTKKNVHPGKKLHVSAVATTAAARGDEDVPAKDAAAQSTRTPQQIAAEKAAQNKKAKEEKRFLDRMARKAKREGRNVEEVVAEHRRKSAFFQG
ncbi:unnamed protein product [Amoebophrya sp. A120]|nr:unnamed protein product [Amoebophrya sp. A120]|eukprot:GSA120T00020825001.1